MFRSRTSEKRGLKIIIVGCGKVGGTLVEQLVKEGHDITVIDKDEERVQALADSYDILGMTGNGASYSLQMEAGIENTDLLIAVTDSDELNLLCCILAKQVGNCSAIARVRTPDYSREVTYLREKLGLAMIINPDLETAREAARLLYLPSALEVHSFARGQAEIIKFCVPEGNILDGMSIAEMGRELGPDVLICAAERDGDVHIPGGDFRIKKGDTLSFVSARTSTKSFLEKIGFKTKQVEDTLIVGGGRVAYYLASRLLHMGISVKIIEKDKKRCEELSVLLPKAVVINGNGMDRDLLEEVGFSYVESIVSLTGIDEENILLTLHAKESTNAKVITKMNRVSFTDVISRLDLGSVIYPRYITSEAIIAYVRAKQNSLNSNVETLYHMYDSKVELIEFRVREESELVGVPLRLLPLKKNLLISFIFREGKVIIPGGEDMLQLGDTVMVVTTHTGFVDLKDILR